MLRSASVRLASLPLLVVIGATALVDSASGLTIHGTYVTQSVLPPPEKLFEGGNLHDIFEAAADLWQAAIHDDFVIEIFYGWSGLQDGILGLSGASFVWLSNEVDWFMDPTPWADEEWPSAYSGSAYLGGNDGPMNIARTFSGRQSDGAWDVLSVLLHEIGHALGLRALPSNNAEMQDGDIDITSPRPFAGASIPLSGRNHLALFNSLMFGGFSDWERRLLSAADILALAQLNGWEQLDLDPSRSVPGDLPLAAAISSAALIALFRTTGLLSIGRRGCG